MQEQSYKNHVKYDPPFHFVGAPFMLILFIGSIVYTIARFSWLSVLMVIASIGLIITFSSLRRFSTKLQDRIIRTEENFRHYTLTGVPLSPLLTISQIIALRFASDDEFPALCIRAVQENMSMDEIKKAVHQWSVDTLRV